MKENKGFKFSLGIRQKVIMVLMTILLVALSLSGWFALQQEKKQIEEETNQRGNDITRFVAKSLAYSIIGYDYQTIQLLLDEITRSDEINFASVVNKRGKEMGAAGSLNDINIPNVKVFKEFIKLDGVEVGELTLGLSSNRVIKRLEANKYSLITREALIILLIAVGEFIALSLIIIRPVKRLSQSLTTTDSNRDHLFDKPVLTSGDEFGKLALKFNEVGSVLQEENLACKKKNELTEEYLEVANAQITQLQQALELVKIEAEKKSNTDALTGLYNRQYFENCITQEMNQDLPQGDVDSMIMIDVDDFKTINERYGQFSGDIVLRVIAETLRENLQKKHILCRVDGEEFAVLCFRTSKKDVTKIAGRLKLSVARKKINIGHEAINITVSLGCASISSEKNTRSINEYYHFANKALYFSKLGGRNKLTHYDDLSKDDLNILLT